VSDWLISAGNPEVCLSLREPVGIGQNDRHASARAVLVMELRGRRVNVFPVYISLYP